MDLKYLQFVKDGEVATLTINRPEALNALNTGVLFELKNVVKELKSDRTIKILILTGAGEKAFVAGADIKEMLSMNSLEARDFLELGQSVMWELENLDKVVIAAVNGYALGGGCELALACDLIVASEKAKFSLPEVGLGVHPGFGGTQRLPRLIGKARAKELIFTGDIIDAKHAEQIGLVNKIVPPEKLMEEAKNIANKILGKGPLAVKLAKAAINRGTEVDLSTGLAYEVETDSIAFSSEDKIEGMKAFIEKRQPNFKGK